MSILIDKLIEKDHETTVQIGGNWYLVKSIPLKTIQQRWQWLKDAIRVLSNKSFAVHYKEDEQKLEQK